MDKIDINARLIKLTINDNWKKYIILTQDCGINISDHMIQVIADAIILHTDSCKIIRDKIQRLHISGIITDLVYQVYLKNESVGIHGSIIDLIELCNKEKETHPHDLGLERELNLCRKCAKWMRNNIDSLKEKV